MNFVKHPLTGLSNGMLGTLCFIASEAMLFAALFMAYATLRAGATHWPVGSMSPWLALAGTACLFGGSWTLTKAEGIEKTWISAVLFTLFLCIKSAEYAGKIVHGSLPATNTFFALYYAMTGVHALHVIGGVIAQFFLIRNWSDTGRQCLSAYWWFTDLIWLILFVLFYVV